MAERAIGDVARRSAVTPRSMTRTAVATVAPVSLALVASGCAVVDGVGRALGSVFTVIALLVAACVLQVELAATAGAIWAHGSVRRLAGVVGGLVAVAHMTFVARAMRELSFIAGTDAWLAGTWVVAAPCLLACAVGVVSGRAPGGRRWGLAAAAVGLVVGGAVAAWLIVGYSPWPQVPRSPIAALHATGPFACARHEDGAMSCWSSGSAWSVAVTGPRDARALDLHRPRSCAIDGERRLWCWRNESSFHPIHAEVAAERVVALGGTQAVGLAGASRAVFLTEGGEAQVLGTSGAVTALHPDLPPLRALSQRGDVGCGLVRDGEAAVCWTLSSHDEAEHRARLGTPIPAPAGATAIAVSARDTCVLGPTGDVTCRSPEGGTSTLHDDAVAIDAGANHACLLTRDGEVWCWGQNRWGQLGQGDLGARDGARRVPIRGRVQALTVDDDASCAVTVDGAARCWGDVSTLLVDPTGAKICARSELFGATGCVPSPAEVRPPG